MSPRNATPLPDDVVRELEAIDAALAGRPVDPELAELADLALAVRDERPRPNHAFAAQLDASAADRFRGRAPRAATANVRPRPWLPAVGAVASVAAATAIALSVIGIDDDSLPGGGGAADTAATTIVPGSAGDDAASSPESGALQRNAAPTETGGTRSGAAAAPPAAAKAPSASQTPGGVPLADSLQAPAPPSGSAGGVTRSVERGAQLRLATTPKRLDEVASGVVRVTDGVGGFVRSSAVDSRPGLGGGASFELEIPSARLQTSLARLSQLASVRSRTEGSQDVTEQVTFMRNRVVALRAERRSLLRQLAAAPSLAETARLRDRLRSIDARLRDAKRSRAALRRRTTYSAVSLQIVTERPREDSGGGAWTPGDALDDAARVLELAAGVTLVALAVLLPLGLLALLGWPLARVVRRRLREQALEPGRSPAA